MREKREKKHKTVHRQFTDNQNLKRTPPGGKRHVGAPGNTKDDLFPPPRDVARTTLKACAGEKLWARPYDTLAVFQENIYRYIEGESTSIPRLLGFLSFSEAILVFILCMNLGKIETNLNCSASFSQQSGVK